MNFTFKSPAVTVIGISPAKSRTNPFSMVVPGCESVYSPALSSTTSSVGSTFDEPVSVVVTFSTLRPVKSSSSPTT